MLNDLEDRLKFGPFLKKKLNLSVKCLKKVMEVYVPVRYFTSYCLLFKMHMGKTPFSPITEAIFNNAVLLHSALKMNQWLGSGAAWTCGDELF